MNSKSMAGWIGFAGIMLLIIGSIAFFQGLIALFEDDYFVVTQSGFLVVDLTAWGWVMLIWGVVLFLAGLGLIAGPVPAAITLIAPLLLCAYALSRGKHAAILVELAGRRRTSPDARN